MISVTIHCRYDVKDEHVDEFFVRATAESFTARLAAHLATGQYFYVVDTNRGTWGYIPETIVSVLVRDPPSPTADHQCA
jgi:hypothetical protein